MNDVVRSRKTFSALGREAFADVLNEMGVPREFIGNIDLIKAINKQKTTSKTSFNRSSNEKTVRKEYDTTAENFQSFADGSFSKASTPKSSKKRSHNQTGSGWLTLNI